MCGIFVALNAHVDAESRLRYTAALTSLKHRGPDNQSSWFSDRAFLGHTRLAIVGLGAASDQPYIFDNLVLVFNGEIFNFVEIRELLCEKGYNFQTTSDTEVVIKAFHCFGLNAFSMFNGMWALVIHNRISNETVICRDRFGQKPLFITKSDGNIYISSELHAIATTVSLVPNLQAIRQFIQEGTCSISGNTFFSNVFEVPKASYIIYRGQNLVQNSRYWQYPDKILDSNGSSEAFLAILSDAIKIRLRTDVDYCILLSGGIDSTIISALTRQLASETKRLTAFTFSSKDKDDETKYAKMVADQLGICLHVVDSDERDVDYLQSLRRLVRLLGRGHSSPAITSVDKIYRNISKMGYKVALDGQGADEILAGYKHYHYHFLVDCILAGSWGQIPSVIRDLKDEGPADVALMAMRNSLPTWGRTAMRRVFGYESILCKIFNQGLDQSPYEMMVKIPYDYDFLDRYLLKQHQEGLSNLLYYGDIVSMANSVENRSPFMDHRIVELAFNSGHEIKIQDGVNKAVLRKTESYSQFKSVLDRKKIGFNTPIRQSIRKRFAEELGDSHLVSLPIFNRCGFNEFVKSDRVVDKRFERFVFRLYQVHLWCDEFIR